MDEMGMAMIQTLASIDAELGLPEDGCNSPARTLHAIRELKKELREIPQLLYEIDCLKRNTGTQS